MVVDTQLIQQESKAARNIQKVFDAKRETFQKEIGLREEQLRAAEQELTRQRSSMSQESFAQRRREFEQQVIDGQRDIQARSRSFEQALSNSMRTVQTKIMQIIAEAALERGANIVVSRNQLLLFDRGLDVTQAILERLNEQLPEVTVAMPSE